MVVIRSNVIKVCHLFTDIRLFTLIIKNSRWKQSFNTTIYYNRSILKREILQAQTYIKHRQITTWAMLSPSDPSWISTRSECPHFMATMSIAKRIQAKGNTTDLMDDISCAGKSLQHDSRREYRWINAWFPYHRVGFGQPNHENTFSRRQRHSTLYDVQLH